MPNNPTPAPKLDALQALQAALSIRARALQLPVIQDPPALAKVELPALQLLATPKSDSPPAFQLPSLFLGPWTVLCGAFEGPAALPAQAGPVRDEVIARWRACQHHAAIVRSALEKSRQDDLMLFLVGPEGSAQDKEWSAFASQIERDDLVCRKLVWLPPRSVQDRPKLLATFVERTFLAKPWQSTGLPVQPALDEISEVGETLTAWQEVLDQQPYDEEAIDYDELAQKLINTYRP